MSGARRRYHAFISYSHAADDRLAPALQKALQRLAKPWYRRRAVEVFRDQTGLSVDPHLWGAIAAALDDSEWLLLLSSPDGARSEWVNREIEHWKTHREVDRILPVLTDGHWEWDPTAGDFTADSDAVAPALRGVFTDEPRHLDLRWAHHETQLDLRNSRFRDAVAELAAPLHGTTKDEIEGEDVRQHRRTVRLAGVATAALAVLTVAAVVAAGVAVTNARRAEDRRIDAEAQRLSAQSQAELARPDLAFLLAAAGYRLRPNVSTEGALLTAVANRPEIRQQMPVGPPVTALALSAASDRIWIGTADGDVVVRRYSDGGEITRIERMLPSEIRALAPAPGDPAGVVAADISAVVTADADLRVTTSRDGRPGDPILAVAVDPATGRIAAGTAAGSVLIWSGTDSRPELAVDGAAPGVADRPDVTALAWTPDGELVVGGADGFGRVDPHRPERPLWVNDGLGLITALTVMPDGTVVAGGVYGAVSFWNPDGTEADGGSQPAFSDTVTQFAVTGLPPADGSVAAVSADGSLRFFDHRRGAALRGTDAELRIDEQDATAVAWDPAAPLHGVAGGRGGAVVVLDYGQDHPRPAQVPAPWTAAAALAAAPDGQRLVVYRFLPSPDGAGDAGAGLLAELVITDPGDLRMDGPSTRFAGVVDQLVYSPDGTRIVAATVDGAVAVWDGTSAPAELTAVAPGQVITQLAVSPDGATVATGVPDFDAPADTPGEVRLWRVEGRRLVPDGSVAAPPLTHGLAFTPDGSRLVIGGSGAVAVHPLTGGTPLTLDIRGDHAHSLAVSPDGALVAVGLYSGPVRLFDLATGQPVGDDLRAAARVTDLAFRADGRQIVAVGESGAFTIWDVASRTPVSDAAMFAVDRTLTGTVTDPSLAVGTDRAYTTSFADGQVVSWPLTAEQWIAIGCRVFARDLTDAERQRFGLEGTEPICPG
ncbi:toll/interleukin-1 receptor domain-containing protein [Mycolicibacterium sp.]|uniref:toll/interleukin-1 receptor domain-containing protein n=1 Tax=Mycolicibacterium sp. TaxID=2320850 RepID=UPI003D134E82